MEYSLRKEKPELPPLFRDRAFLGMTATQFLGAFNDNVFKQMVLLICLDYKALHNLKTDVGQTAAAILFALAFVMFSGLAGFLSDRMRKRRIVILCKVAEIIVMLIGMATFFVAPVGSGQLIVFLVVVIFLMGTQSAFFGPSKYGILPEMLNDEDLPIANGTIQMTTFLAIILGIGLAGVLKDVFGGELWKISAVCVGIAVVGTLCATLLRSTPVAKPDLKFSPSCLTMERDARKLIWNDRLLFWVILVYAAFWFAGNIVLLTVNTVGKIQLGLEFEWQVSLLPACMAIGIALGCVTSGLLSRKEVRFGLVTAGAWGVLAGLSAASAISILPININVKLGMLFLSLIVSGFFAGLFAVPLQVFLQARPPEDKKGRVLGAMNLITWIGILVSTGYYYICTTVMALVGIPPSWTLLTVGILMGLIAMAFRPDALVAREKPEPA